jgi:hypothetical protein
MIADYIAAAERIEALRQGRNGFIGRENSPPVGDQRQSDALRSRVIVKSL